MRWRVRGQVPRNVTAGSAHPATSWRLRGWRSGDWGGAPVTSHVLGTRQSPPLPVPGRLVRLTCDSHLPAAMKITVKTLQQKVFQVHKHVLSGSVQG